MISILVTLDDTVVVGICHRCIELAFVISALEAEGMAGLITGLKHIVRPSGVSHPVIVEIRCCSGIGHDHIIHIILCSHKFREMGYSLSSMLEVVENPSVVTV